MTREASQDALLPATAELARLMRAAHDRTPKSVRELMLAIHPWLVRYFRAAFSADEADDLAQMVLIGFAKRISRPDGGPNPEKVGMYIVTSARNLAVCGVETYRLRRDRRRHVGLDYILDAPDPRSQHNPDVAYRGRELECAFAVACRERLLPHERAIVARLLLGDKYREIAYDEGEVTVRAISQRVSRLRRKLRALLAPYLSEDRASNRTKRSELRPSESAALDGGERSRDVHSRTDVGEQSGAAPTLDGIARASGSGVRK